MAPTERFTSMDEKLRVRLMTEAQSEFSDKGYEGASLNGIIQRAGISKGSFYYYFADKADLYITVVSDAMESFMASHDETPDLEADFWGGIRLWIRALIEHSFAQPEIIKLMSGLRTVSAQAKESERFQRMYLESMETMSRVLAKGKEAGEVRTDLPDQILAMSLQSVGIVMDLWHAENFDEARKLGIDRLTDRYLDAFFRLAAPADRLKSAPPIDARPARKQAPKKKTTKSRGKK